MWKAQSCLFFPANNTRVTSLLGDKSSQMEMTEDSISTYEINTLMCSCQPVFSSWTKRDVRGLEVDVKPMSWVSAWLSCYKTLPWFWPCKPAVFMLETQSSLSPSTSHTTELLWLHTCSSHFEKLFNESGTTLWVVWKSWVIIFKGFYPFSGVLNRNSSCLRPSSMKFPSQEVAPEKCCLHTGIFLIAHLSRDAWGI